MSIRRERNNPPTRDPMDMAPGLGYRISSDRQPGIEQANMRRMPQYKPLPITPDYERPMPMPLPMQKLKVQKSKISKNKKYMPVPMQNQK